MLGKLRKIETRYHFQLINNTKQMQECTLFSYRTIYTPTPNVFIHLKPSDIGFQLVINYTKILSYLILQRNRLLLYDYLLFAVKWGQRISCYCPVNKIIPLRCDTTWYDQYKCSTHLLTRLLARLFTRNTDWDSGSQFLYRVSSPFSVI